MELKDWVGVIGAGISVCTLVYTLWRNRGLDKRTMEADERSKQADQRSREAHDRATRADEWSERIEYNRHRLEAMSTLNDAQKSLLAAQQICDAVVVEASEANETAIAQEAMKRSDGYGKLIPALVQHREMLETFVYDPATHRKHQAAFDSVIADYSEATFLPQAQSEAYTASIRNLIQAKRNAAAAKANPPHS